jgi:RNA polymerase sigma-70 factor (ECF subfamily)
MDEARDLTNEVFLRLYQKLSKFTQYSSFGGWLRTLTKNMAIDYLRRKANIISIDDDSSGNELSKINSGGEDEVINRMTYDNIISQIEKLSPPYRDVALLFYRDNWTIKQISRSTHIPGNTVKSYLFRMRKKFNKNLSV